MTPPSAPWWVRVVRGFGLALLIFSVHAVATVVLIDLIDDRGGGYRGFDEREEAGEWRPYFLHEDLEEWNWLVFVPLWVAFTLVPVPAQYGRATTWTLAAVQGLAWSVAIGTLLFLYTDAQEMSPTNRVYTIPITAAITAACAGGLVLTQWRWFADTRATGPIARP